MTYHQSEWRDSRTARKQPWHNGSTPSPQYTRTRAASFAGIPHWRARTCIKHPARVETTWPPWADSDHRFYHAVLATPHKRSGPQKLASTRSLLSRARSFAVEKGMTQREVSTVLASRYRVERRNDAAERSWRLYYRTTARAGRDHSARRLVAAERETTGSFASDTEMNQPSFALRFWSAFPNAFYNINASQQRAVDLSAIRTRVRKCTRRGAEEVSVVAAIQSGIWLLQDD